MATTSNIYPKHVSNVIIGKGDGVAGRNYQTVAHKYGGNTVPCDTLFSQDAFNSIPDGSTVNSLTIAFEGALTDNDGNKSTYKKGKWSVDKIGYPQGWNGVYTGYNNLPSITWIANVGYTTGELQYDWKTYSCSVSGITLAHLRAGLFIRTNAHHITSMSTSSRFYMQNFHVVVDYTEPPYTITYNGNGATSGSVASQSCHFGTDIALNGNNFAKSYVVSFDKNYSGTSQTHAVSAAKFRGWEDHGTITASNGEVFTAEQFDAPFYANTHTDLYNAFKYNKQSLVNHYVSNGRSEGRACTGSPRGVYPSGATVNSLAPNGGSVLLKAQWSAMPAITLDTPERDGYTFLGWYTAAEGGTKVGNAGESYTPTRSITLYAHWINSAIKSIYLGNKLASLYLGLKQILRIFKGLTEIYYDPFAD